MLPKYFSSNYYLEARICCSENFDPFNVLYDIFQGLKAIKMSSNLNKELPAPVLQFLGSCGKYGSLSESAQKLLQGINPAIDAKQIDEVVSA